MEGGIFPMIFQLKSMEGLESKRYTPQSRGAKRGGLYYSLNVVIKI